MSLFQSKAQTLDFIKEQLRSSRVPFFIHFTRSSWENDENALLVRISDKCSSDTLIIRSSARGEDGYSESMAGKYLSVANIRTENRPSLIKAINAVFASYSSPCAEDEVIVQHMIENVALSGVAFTRHAGTGSPYYIIDYDDETGQTDTITAGKGVAKSLLVWRKAPLSWINSERMRKILLAMQELETVCKREDLDIEFALDTEGTVWTLQVRPITTLPANITDYDALVEKELKSIEHHFLEQKDINLGHLATDVLFGDMPDWNPAEMIGTCPSPLAYSLYRALITEDVWRRARRGMGYSTIPSAELMQAFGGHPFIDLRASFTSFLPEGIQADIGRKLVDAWIGRIKASPEYHDKVEFQVATTCHTPRLMTVIHERYGDLCRPKEYNEYSDLLKNLTNNCVMGKCEYSLSWCREQMDTLCDIQKNSVIATRMDEFSNDHRAAIITLIKECKDFGTLPFAAAARHAFIAESILRDLLYLGALDDEDIASIKSSIHTITNDIIQKISDVKNNKCSRESFFESYGHIRPSSYDIESRRYDDMGHLFEIDAGISPPEPNAKARIEITENKKNKVTEIFQSTGYFFDYDSFVAYLRQAVQLREEIKMHFMRHVSDIIEIIALQGSALGFSRDDIAHVSCTNLLSMETANMRQTLKQEIKINRERHSVFRNIFVNYLIGDIKDIYVVPIQRSKPNFVTRKRIAARAVEISALTSNIPDLKGKIVCIERADPGFDWIFGCGIEGLVTKYGGSNSHMTIRCAEFGIPAAIGCGEMIYRRLSKADFIDMDCKAEFISALES